MPDTTMKLLDERNHILEISTKLITAGLIHDGQGNLSIYNREMDLIAITPSAVQYDQRKDEDICVVDLEGNVVGINFARASRVASYALPVSSIKPVLADLMSKSGGLTRVDSGE